MTHYILPVFLNVVFLVFFTGNSSTENAPKLISEVDKTSKIIDSYDSILMEINLDSDAFKLAYNAYKTLISTHKLSNDTLLTIVDYSKSSDTDRLFIIDMKNLVLIEKSLVAHGQNSGVVNANEFSNRKQSHKSSLGLFVTSVTYFGKHGYSLRIDGLEEGINDNARERAIVFHGAHYVSQSYIEQNGRLGRSFGCPAIPYDKTQSIINLIKDGSCVYIYHPTILSKIEESNLTFSDK